MSQTDLAEACDRIGAPELTDQVIQRIERGERRPKLNAVYRLACALGVSPFTLLMPAEADAELTLTDTASAPAAEVYEWMTGLRPAPTRGEVNDAARGNAWLRFRQHLPYASRLSGKLRLEVDINENNIAEILREDGREES